MKYQLPSNLKTHLFWCEKTKDAASYRRCKMRCGEDFRACWERGLGEALKRNCALENQMNARRLVHCPRCGSVCGIALPLSRFWCEHCGHIETCDDVGLRRILGKEYLKFDEKQCNNALSAVKSGHKQAFKKGSGAMKVFDFTKE